MRLFTRLAVLAAALALASTANAQALHKISAIENASEYNFGVTATAGRVYSAPSATGSGVMQLSSPYVTFRDGSILYPYSTTAPITINPGYPNMETVTPSAVSNCTTGSNPPVNACQITASFTYIHGSGEPVYSGSGGAIECVNAVHGAGGGVCLIAGNFVLAGNSSSSAATTQLTAARALYGNAGIVDLRQGTLNIAPNVLQGKCEGTLTASSTLGFYTLGETSSPACTTTLTSGQIMNHAGTVSTLNVTAVTGGVSSSSGVVTVNVRHNTTTTNTTITCTLGTGTSCSDLTHSANFLQGDVVAIQITTQGSETLANVVATVAAN